MMDRRTFLGTVTAGTLLASRFSLAAEAHKIDKVGVQLYTVRDAIKQDFEGTVAKVAAVGYKEVECAGYFDHAPKDVKAIFDRNGLTAPSSHVDYKSLSPETWPKVLEAANVIGHKYLVNPWIPEEVRKQPDGWKQAADTFNRVGEASKKAGIQFAYHNHWFEFFEVDGKLPYDNLLAWTDPKLVQMELDLCWIYVGGQDPFRYFDKWPGRFPLVHVKDLTSIPKVSPNGPQDFGSSLKEMTDVGSGVLDWKKIFAQSGKAGIKHYFVEHDNPKDPFGSIKSSYDYLAKLRF